MMKKRRAMKSQHSRETFDSTNVSRPKATRFRIQYAEQTDVQMLMNKDEFET